MQKTLRVFLAAAEITFVFNSLVPIFLPAFLFPQSPPWIHFHTFHSPHNNNSGVLVPPFSHEPVLKLKKQTKTITSDIKTHNIKIHKFFIKHWPPCPHIHAHMLPPSPIPMPFSTRTGIAHEKANFHGSETDPVVKKCPWGKRNQEFKKKTKKEKEEEEAPVLVPPTKHTEHVRTRLLLVLVD